MSKFEGLPGFEGEPNIDHRVAKSKEGLSRPVWIIDDNQEYAALLSEGLGKNYQVRIFPDGESAITVAHSLRKTVGVAPMVVLVDGDLGGNKLTGPEIVEKLCKLGIGTETRTTFITLSGDSAANDAMEAKARANGAPVAAYGKRGSLRELKKILAGS
jgi:CheY-like chemotaxis protein